MRLEKWLELKNMRSSAFAQKVGIHKRLVHKYLHEGVIPRRKNMRKIYIETLGVVSANDFFRITDELFEEDPS